MFLVPRPECVRLLSGLGHARPQANRPTLRGQIRACGQKLALDRPQQRAITSASSGLILAPPYSRRWSEDDLRKLFQMKDANIPLDEIAAKLQRTPRACVERIRRGPGMPMSKKLWTDAELDTLFDLRDRGVSVADIARELNRSEHKVQSRLQRPRHLPNRRPWSVEEFEKLLVMHKQFCSTSAIAAELGRSIDSVNFRMKNLTYRSTAKPKPWSQVELDKLAEMYAQRVPHSNIALHLQRSTQSVEACVTAIRTGRRSTLPGATRPGAIPFTRAEDHELMRLRRLGKGWNAISRELPVFRDPSGLRSRYATLLRMNGPDRRIDYSRRIWSDEEDVLVLNLLAQGNTLTEISKRMNIGLHNIKSRIVALKKLTGGLQASQWRAWKREEDDILLSMRSEKKSWKEIASSVGTHRTHQAAEGRYRYLMRKQQHSLIHKQKTIGSPTRPTLQPAAIDTTSNGGRREYSTEAKRGGHIWTQDDFDVLARMYIEGMSIQDMASVLDRTWQGVKWGIHKLPPSVKEQVVRPTKTQRSWTPSEFETLREMQNAGSSVAEIATVLNRTPASVEETARNIRNGRRSEDTHRFVDAEEDEKLLKLGSSGALWYVDLLKLLLFAADWGERAVGHYLSFDMRDIALQFPDRDLDGLRDRYKKLKQYGVTTTYSAPKWTPGEETQLLELNKRGLTRSEIALALNRSPYSVKMKLWRILHQKNEDESKSGAESRSAANFNGVKWTREEEVALLRMRADGADFHYIGAKLGRTRGSVRRKEFGLSIARRRELLEEAGLGEHAGEKVEGSKLHVAKSKPSDGSTSARQDVGEKEEISKIAKSKPSDEPTSARHLKDFRWLYSAGGDKLK